MKSQKPPLLLSQKQRKVTY